MLIFNTSGLCLSNQSHTGLESSLSSVLCCVCTLLCRNIRKKCARVTNQNTTGQGFAKLQLQHLVDKQAKLLRNGNIS